MIAALLVSVALAAAPSPTPTLLPAEACSATSWGHDWERVGSPPQGGIRCRRCGRWRDGTGEPGLSSSDALYAYMVRDAVDRGAWLTTRTATATPMPNIEIKATARYKSGKLVEIRSEKLSSVDFAQQVLKGTNAWIVTATATVSPTATAQATPTVSGDCCHDGHAWQPLKVKSKYDEGTDYDETAQRYAGGTIRLHYREEKRRGLRYDPGRIYGGTSVTAVRCRRCGLWQEVP